MFRNTLTGLNKKKLRIYLALFFLALLIPTVILITQAYSQLKWQAFHRHQIMAEELTKRIDQRLLKLIEAEEARTYTDYTFLNVIGDPTANFLQRSTLSNFPVRSDTPGILGYFQVDAQGKLTTPLLPSDEQQSLQYGVSEDELVQRRQLQNKIQGILSQNSLVKKQDVVIDRTGKSIKDKAKVKRDRAADMSSPEPSQLMDSAMATLGEVADLAKGTNSYDADGAVRFDTRETIDETLTGGFARDFNDANNVVVEEQMPQAAFDELSTKEERKKNVAKNSKYRSLGRVEDLELVQAYESVAPATASVYSKKIAKLEKQRVKRLEQNALPEKKQKVIVAEKELDAVDEDIQINLFESEIDPFTVSMLDSGHFVMFRNVWRDGKRYVQGVLIDPEKLVRGVVETIFRSTSLSQMSNLAFAYQGNILAVISGQGSERYSSRYSSSSESMKGSLLYQKQLSAPLSDVELIFSINHLPAGPAGTVINWIAIILLIVLCGGFMLMYRLGVVQINLARQQQDFVSAVSHELKTPLTSIRMYGEMLVKGWADEDKKKSYYNYIHDESERLSRLINNVLQLARMTRNELQVEMKQVSIHEMLDMIQSKISSAVERAGYNLNVSCNEELHQKQINIDVDYFNQIMINLVDNAIKFSAKANKTDIDINCTVQQDGSVLFTVRDYGPGVAKDQMRKIFKLFYRSENELTRETVGTGIGLALVHQLAQAMDAKVDVINCDPGAEFRITFPS